MQYLRDVSEMSCGTTAIMQMRLQQDSSNSSRIVRITATSKFLDVIFSLYETSCHVYAAPSLQGCICVLVAMPYLCATSVSTW